MILGSGGDYFYCICWINILVNVYIASIFLSPICVYGSSGARYFNDSINSHDACFNISAANMVGSIVLSG